MVQPWMQALEMQFAALKVLRAKFKLLPAFRTDLTRAGRDIIGALLAAQTYSWSEETVRAVWLASRTVPLSSRLEVHLLPASCGWWWFDAPPGAGDMNALAWLICPDSIDVLVFVLDHEQPTLWAHLFWQSGASVDDLLSGVQDDFDQQLVKLSDDKKRVVADTCRFFLAGLAWIHQRILCMSSGHIERHRRKQIAREHNVPMPSDVKVIQLRRTESSSRLPSANGAESVEWSCRWIVNGHWRNQPYPSKDERKLIYIMPYVKGPEDRPLRVPTHTVYSVSR